MNKIPQPSHAERSRSQIRQYLKEFEAQHYSRIIAKQTRIIFKQYRIIACLEKKLEQAS